VGVDDRKEGRGLYDLFAGREPAEPAHDVALKALKTDCRNDPRLLVCSLYMWAGNVKLLSYSGSVIESV
jgi:hypothetical protein